jgi:hypothetical protein
MYSIPDDNCHNPPNISVNAYHLQKYMVGQLVAHESTLRKIHPNSGDLAQIFVGVKEYRMSKGLVESGNRFSLLHMNSTPLKYEIT